ncbi:hypothetical protein N0V91_001892 [Didymella pomorum]|uniref:Uncharacterized protein n=1 Tax=Didymella pomorum TaxID=749634 RepID=A0A9W9D9W4_9PLEO|nr:hypothetical protein N0V91_001892 [Didymella pomorum]
MDGDDSYQVITPYLNQKAAENLAYAQQCYQLEEHERPDSCKITTIPTLPYKVDRNAACPFPAGLCKLSSDPERGGANYTRYYYGGGSFNYTFEVVNNPTWLTSEKEGDYQIMYVLFVPSSIPCDGYVVGPLQERFETMRWVPELLIDHAQTTLYFLVPFGIAYMNQTDDPWFSANTPSGTLMPFDGLHIDKDLLQSQDFRPGRLPQPI